MRLPGRAHSARCRGGDEWAAEGGHCGAWSACFTVLLGFSWVFPCLRSRDAGAGWRQRGTTSFWPGVTSCSFLKGFAQKPLVSAGLCTPADTSGPKGVSDTCPYSLGFCHCSAICKKQVSLLPNAMNRLAAFPLTADPANNRPRWGFGAGNTGVHQAGNVPRAGRAPMQTPSSPPHMPPFRRQFGGRLRTCHTSDALGMNSALSHYVSSLSAVIP